MSTKILDPLPANSPISTAPRPLLRSAPTSFLNQSQENVVEGAIPQSVSRPSSRRSSRIFTNNLSAREDSLGSNMQFGISHFGSYKWAESPVAYESPISKPRIAHPKDSIENSWGVSSIGRGFDWTWSSEPEKLHPSEEPEETADEPIDTDEDVDGEDDIVKPLPLRSSTLTLGTRSLSLDVVPLITQNSQKMTLSLSDGILIPHGPPLPQNGPTTPVSVHNSSVPPSPRNRRRSSQKRFSLVSGRLSYTPPPSPPPDSTIPRMAPPKLLRLASASSFMSVTSAVAVPPTPGKVHYIGDRSIGEYVIQGDVGRGAYGLVKRGREVMSDGSYGVSACRCPTRC
jgi:hypothetical protein